MLATTHRYTHRKLVLQRSGLNVYICSQIFDHKKNKYADKTHSYLYIHVTEMSVTCIFIIVAKKVFNVNSTIIHRVQNTKRIYIYTRKSMR